LMPIARMGRRLRQIFLPDICPSSAHRKTAERMGLTQQVKPQLAVRVPNQTGRHCHGHAT
jgi:hypothetical protein